MPKALSAIVNSHPFATRRPSAVRTQQEESPPPDGVDSCYGVRSISSVSWSSDGSDSTALAPGHSHAAHKADATDHTASAGGGEGVGDLKSVRDVQHDEHDSSDNEHTDSSGSEELESTPDASRSLQLHTPAPAGRQEQASTPATSCDRDPEGAAAHPPGPSPTAHIVHAPAVLTRERSRSLDKTPGPVVSHALFDMLQDAPSASEPSSPASLASLPSCTASMSSLSRLSSPADWDQRAQFMRPGAPGSTASASSVSGERQELVLPTLALPNTSLHLGLERWAGEGAGTRIALVAPPERTRDVLAVIAGKRKCVQLAHGEVGVVARSSTGYGELEATIITGLSANDIARRTHDAYALLHSLLNPSPDPEKRREMAKIVTAHSIVADWVHVAFVLDGELSNGSELTADEDDLTALDIVPVTTLEQETRRDARSLETPRWSAGNIEPWSFDAGLPGVPEYSSSSGSPRSPLSQPSYPSSYPSSLPSSSSDEEPEPRPRPAEEEGDEPTPPSTPDTVRQAASALEALLSDRRVRDASVSAFLAWHPESPEASTLVAEPQPTLAHAAAGGEWEATLSRRLAARRELDAAAQAAAARCRATPRGRRMRRRKSASPTPCGPGPLFPRRSAPLATGLAGLIESVFAPVRKWRPWAIVAAIAVAVGCGIWAVRAA